MMKEVQMFDFSTPVDRHGTWCTQWDYVADRFGAPTCCPLLSPIWISPPPLHHRCRQQAPGARRFWLQPLEKR
jgi:hypothetical protein